MKTIHNDVYQILVERLKAARQKANLSQSELAARLGTDQSYVSKYERSERRLDVLEVRALCRQVGVGFVQFLQEFEEELKRSGFE